MRLEFTDKLTDGSPVHIRPIRCDDVERERSFVDGLSQRSKYYRFLGGVGHLTEKQLQNFCDIDRDHEMAFIALTTSNGADIQVGVAQYVADADNREAEIAVTVADRWQGKGLGTILLKHLIDYARHCGVQRLYSIELATNNVMQKLVHDMGFSSSRAAGDSTQVINTLDLTASA